MEFFFFNFFSFFLFRGATYITDLPSVHRDYLLYSKDDILCLSSYLFLLCEYMSSALFNRAEQIERPT